MSWPMVVLSDVAEIQGGIQKQPKRAPSRNAFPFLRVANVTARGLDLVDVHQIELFEGDLERYGLRRGDLLVVEGNGSARQIGRAAVWDGSIADAVHQNHLIRVRPGPELDERFLGLLWNSPLIRDDLARVASSTSGLHTLSVAKLKRVALPLPPLDEQRRILGVLEDHLSRLDAADAYLDAAERRLEAWRHALIDDAIWSGDPRTSTVGDLLREPMRNGRSDRAATGEEPGTRTLTLTSVTRNRFDNEFTKMTITSPEVAAGLWLEPGDIFVQRSNTPELVGTAARYDGPSEWAIYPDLLIRLRPDESRIDGRYLVAALRSRSVHRTLRKRAKGLAGSMPKIDQRAIAQTVVPLPDSEHQGTVIERIAEIDGIGAATLSAIAKQRKRSAALRRSLLVAAFSGRLSGAFADAEVLEKAAI